MTRPDYIPESARHIKIVGSFEEMCAGTFSSETNMFLHPCPLKHNFNALAEKLWERNVAEKERNMPSFIQLYGRMLQVELEEFTNDPAAQELLDDAERVTKANHPAILRLVYSHGGENYHEANSFHHDRGLRPGSTRIIRSYTGPVTEFIDNDDAIEVPDGEKYNPRTGVTPFAPRLGDMWIQVSHHSRSPASSPVHRAPKSEGLRMLLVSNLAHKEMRGRFT